jgi:hypothetical protein
MIADCLPSITIEGIGVIIVTEKCFQPVSPGHILDETTQGEQHFHLRKEHVSMLAGSKSEVHLKIVIALLLL